MSPERKSMKITKKGQVTIPKKFRDALTVEDGDVLYASLEGEKVIFSRPGIPQPGEPVGARSYQNLLKALERAKTG
jgi:AbrB family looped-hinge helix DNA binding protein